jgi:hypothetical protein
MTRPDKKALRALNRLANALVEDVLTTPDPQILAEFIDTRGDPRKNSDAMRSLFEKSVLNVRKARLRAAQAGVAGSRSTPATRKAVSIEDARVKLRRVLASCPPQVKLTLAARNEDELSDADVLGMLQDLEELGVVLPDDSSHQ